jgi:hypothetical protein
MRKFRTTVYARMEEMSFRSGAAAGAAALAAVGIAIALAVTLTGHSAAATSGPAPTAPARSVPSPSVTPSVTATPSSTPVRSASPAASRQAYVPASGLSAPQPPPSAAPPTASLWPQRPHRRLPLPGRTGVPSPIPPGWPF